MRETRPSFVKYGLQEAIDEQGHKGKLEIIFLYHKLCSGGSDKFFQSFRYNREEIRLSFVSFDIASTTECCRRKLIGIVHHALAIPAQNYNALGSSIMFHRSIVLSIAFLGASLLGFGIPSQEAQAHGPRQYYSSWNRHPSANYHYRHYYYKPSPNYSGYRHHYVIYHIQRPKHLYFYNPYTRKYWGRCPIGSQGTGSYSMLAEKDRAGSLNDIPESAFPEPTAVPPVPEATDKLPLDLPPDDLPDVKQPGLTTPALPAS